MDMKVKNVSRNVRKRTYGWIPCVRPESSLGAFWIAKYAKFYHEDNED